jgi:branched-chain amino acid transport system substrate-binding protein
MSTISMPCASHPQSGFRHRAGKFAFSANQHPVQDLYIREVIKGSDAEVHQPNDRRRFLKITANVYIDHCKMD